MSKNDPPDLEFALVKSRYIAGLIGPALLAIASAMLLNRGLLPEIVAEAVRNKALIFLTGLLLLIAGLAIIQLHSTWRGWPAVVTAIGWLSVVSGLARILFPFELADLAPRLITGPAPMIAALGGMAIGAFLTAKAYL